jgi:apolipoprotein N-acyltransferase
MKFIRHSYSINDRSVSSWLVEVPDRSLLLIILSGLLAALAFATELCR